MTSQEAELISKMKKQKLREQNVILTCSTNIDQVFKNVPGTLPDVRSLKVDKIDRS